MEHLLEESAFFGVLISIIGYQTGLFLRKKFKLAIFNPLLVSILLIIAVLLVFHVDYDSYNSSAKFLSYLLTPATICLAAPLYEQLELLKKNYRAILIGIISGVLSSLGSIFVFSLLFHFSHAEYATLLPKSITTAIGMGVSEELGGIVTITVTVIIITGVLGNMMAERVCRLFRIKDPIARGIAIGTAAHAIGTAKAMEMGEIEGAMSSLAIAVAGLITVVGASIFANFI
jgi:predicted murein hydrolase (TIGR00659 family)